MEGLTFRGQRLSSCLLFNRLGLESDPPSLGMGRRVETGLPGSESPTRVGKMKMELSLLRYSLCLSIVPGNIVALHIPVLFSCVII